jgi:hypothetical protein
MILSIYVTRPKSDVSLPDGPGLGKASPKGNLFSFYWILLTDAKTGVNSSFTF